MGSWIERQLAQFDQRFGASGLAPQQGANPGRQFFQVKRLDQVVVGAAIQAGHPVRYGVARSEYQHRNPVAAGAQRLQDLQAVLFR